MTDVSVPLAARRAHASGGLRWLQTPLDDYTWGLRRMAHLGALGFLLGAFGCAAGYWLYVPVHELLHAFGCWATGGQVTRLEISPIYGAALLERWFPFVAVGSEYAGQLTGFDTHGKDLVYLATDGAPFLLSIFAGVPLFRRLLGSSGRTSLLWALGFGAALPIAFAPFISLAGDYYEMGSVLVSRGASFVIPGFELSRWRSDDLFKLSSTLFSPLASVHFIDVAGVSLAALIGCVLCLATYALGVRCSSLRGVERHAAIESS
jgi:hypothetical protein